MRNFQTALLIVMVAVLTACGISKQAEIDLNKPVNCATAEQDIEVLESEKANIAEMFLNGVTAVPPPAIVLNILTHKEVEKIEIAIGHYNKMIIEKIAEIKRECNIE